MKPAREPATSRPNPCASLKKPNESCPFAAPCGPRRKRNNRGQTSVFPSETSRFTRLILAPQGFSPPLARRRSSCPPPLPNLVRTRSIEHYQALRDSAPCLSRAATLPKGTKLELGRGAHLGTPSSANHIAPASPPTGRIAKAASWLHLSRVSLALHPPERPFRTRTPKPGFGGRRHEYNRVFKLYCTLVPVAPVAQLVTSKSSDTLGHEFESRNWGFSRTIKSLVHKIRLHGRRGKGTAESFSREKLRQAPQMEGG